MTLTDEQIKQILDGAPIWAGHWDDALQGYYDADDEFNLNLLREIQLLREQNQQLINDRNEAWFKIEELEASKSKASTTPAPDDSTC